MKTREKSVIVVVSDDGRMKRFVYPIATKEGELMTRRLRRLLAGKINCSGAERVRDIHFIGMEWYEPYTILNELRDDCTRLQNEILAIDEHADLSDPLGLIEQKHHRYYNNDDRISHLIRHQLDTRRRLQRRLREVKAAKASGQKS